MRARVRPVCRTFCLSCFACSSVKVMGFSMTTSNPLSKAIIAGSKWVTLGVTIDMKSIRSPSGRADSFSIISAWEK